MRCRCFIKIAIALALATSAALAQSEAASSSQSQQQLADRLEKSRDDVVSAAKEYRASLEKLLALLESDMKSATDTVEKRKALYAQGLISRKELGESEQSLSDAKLKVDRTQAQISETDDLITEASAAVELPPVPQDTYRITSAIIRYSGAVTWSISDVGKVDGFFASRFGRSLPVSALGQSATHDRLGFDHRNNVDVALHPDSPEGQALMAYLRSAGIPFIAFRQAVAGSATGAHIHIGPPSHRIAR